MCEENRENSEMSSSPSDNADIIPGYNSIAQFTKDGYNTLMEAIKHSNALPSGRDWNFYNTSDSFKQIIHNEGTSVLSLMNQVMRCSDVETNIRNRVLDEKIELIIDANDVILEKVANNIDELNGVRTVGLPPVELQTVSAQLPVNGSWNRPNAATFTVNSKVAQSREKSCIKLLTAKNIVRPQKFFKDKVDNRNKAPWQPRITEKPNSLKPLAIFLEESDDRQEFSHPYEYELDRFAPTPEQLVAEIPEFPKPLSDTPLIEITKPEQLDELVETLRSCKEFAVDVEHHSYRSFMGITCLLQISTKDKDYLIDTLALRDKLDILNEVFTKNTIIKIFHGADKDIEWLQRDLSIYVVNMFDTHQAAKLLQYSGLSLAFLMKKFCNVLPNKEYQLADWRIRPLPEELKQYAREDTHYLIYIYKMLVKELLQKANNSDNLLKSVIERSTNVCKKRYFKPILHDDSHLEMYVKCKKMFDNRQMYALREIYAWRDQLAREEDESLGYVLPNHMLLQISETLPREMQGILACCNPIPPLVRSNLLSLHHIILKAREQPLEKAIMRDTTGRGVLKKVSKINVDSALHCPHDLSKTSEFRDDLPTLLYNEQMKSDIRKLANEELPIEKPVSYSIFENNDRLNERTTLKKLVGLTYLSPFERYKLVKPFAIAEDEEAKKKEDENKQADEAVEENTNRERTDEERIASIKDHFVQLSKKFSEELQAQKEKEEMEQEEERSRQRSLLQMGGTRKRKRDEFELSQQESFVDYNFHSSVPNFNVSQQFGNQNKRKKQKGKKRKFNEAIGNQEIGEEFGGKRVARNQQQNNQQKQRQPKKNRQQFNQQQQQQNNQQKQQNKKQNQQMRQNQQTNKNQNNPHQPLPKAKNKKQKNQTFEGVRNPANSRHQQNKFKQNSGMSIENNFSPYDYASVDFRQFQGGAGSANTGAQIKHNYTAKNRKPKNKKAAKSATFANMGRGRGRQNTNY